MKENKGASVLSEQDDKRDILTLFEQLNSHEVFTPPRVAKEMLALLPKDIWCDPSIRILDPCVKSGVFLREALYLLIDGLAGKGKHVGHDGVEYDLNDGEQRMNHILKNMLFGIATSELTGYISRRTLYGVMEANTDKQTALIDAFEKSKSHKKWTEEEKVRFLVRNHFNEYYDHGLFNTPDYAGFEHEGNIFYPAEEVNKKAEDGADFIIEDTYYPFIEEQVSHGKIQQIKDGQMKFDVVIGNPPYQITGGGGGFATPVYHKFVESALAMKPKYVSMITPSRWLAGGHGLNDFRSMMLGSGKISKMVDFPVSSEVFAGVDIKGGVSYFLYDPKSDSTTDFVTVRDGVATRAKRVMDEFDVFVRDPVSVEILKKVSAFNEATVDQILTAVEPFKWASNFKDYKEESSGDDIPVYFTQKGKRGIGYVTDEQVVKNRDLILKHKVLAPKAGSGGGMIPDVVLGKPWLASSPSVCTGSFMFFYAETEEEAKNIEVYYKTKFFRFLVSLRKITQDAIRSTYTWVPMQDFTKKWTDEDLFEKYGLSEDECNHIETLIKDME